MTDIPSTPHNVTRLYFHDGSAFGSRHARPTTVVITGRTWNHEQLIDAARIGASGGTLHPDVLAALCARYIELAAAQGATAELRRELDSCQVALDLERQAHQGTMFAREQAEDLHVAELAERNRIARLHAEASAHAARLTHQLAQISAENVHLRHQLAGTTPAGIQIALERAAARDKIAELERRLLRAGFERVARAVEGRSYAEVNAALDVQAAETFDDLGDDTRDVWPTEPVVMDDPDARRTEVARG